MRPLSEIKKLAEELVIRLGLLRSLPAQKCRHVQIVNVLVHLTSGLLHLRVMHNRCRRRWWRRCFLHLLRDFHFLRFRRSLPGFC